MNIIYKYEVRLPINKGTYFNENIFKKEELKIAFENEHFIVLDEINPTKVTKSKDWEVCYDRLGKEKIEINLRPSTYWGNGITYLLYSTTKVRPTTIKKKIQARIDKELGNLTSIDLSIIT